MKREELLDIARNSSNTIEIKLHGVQILVHSPRYSGKVDVYVSKDHLELNFKSAKDFAEFFSTPILVGNTFPTTFIRRYAEFFPISRRFAQMLMTSGFVSYYGHKDTTGIVKQLTGFDVTPAENRPALGLSSWKLPRLNGAIFKKVLCISADYKGEVRPPVGQRAALEEIKGWSFVLIRF